MKTIVLLLAMLSPPAIAQVVVTGAWARATPPGAVNGVIYLTLTSPVADTLIGASTPAARSATLHTETEANGVVHMAALPGGIVLPPNRAVALKPGGEHIMLEGLSAGLLSGGAVSLHLVFAHAAPVDVHAKILPIGATGPADSMAGMDMSH